MNSMLMELFGLPEIKQFALKQILLVITEVLFNSYFSILLGATLFALVYHAIGKKSKNALLLRFARDLFSQLYMSRWAAVILVGGTLTAIALFKGFFLYDSASGAIGVYAIALILMLLGLSFSFSFQNYLIFSSKEEALKEPGQENAYLAGSASSGYISFILLLLGAWAYSTASTEAGNELLWGAKASVAFSHETWAQLLQMVALALPMSAGAMLFLFFNDHRIKLSPEYASLVGQRANWILWSYSIVLPIVIVLKVCAIPNNAINTASVLWSVLAVALTFGIFHMAHALKKGQRTRFDKIILPAFILLVLLLTLSEKSAMMYGIRNHVKAVKEKVYEKKAEEGDHGVSHHAPLQMNRF